MELAAIHADWRSCTKELEEWERTEQEKLRLLDLWSFQRNEIESARLKPGEDMALDQERRVLQNVTRLLEAANTAYAALTMRRSRRMLNCAWRSASWRSCAGSMTACGK